MARIAPTLLVLALLAGTAAAFVVTEALKLRPSPITRPRIDKVFSPTCRCPTDKAAIAFVLRRTGRLTVQIVRDDQVVRTLLANGRHRHGWVRLSWDGRNAAGTLLPDGPYRVRVEFPSGQLRRIDLPNPLAIDTHAPSVQRARLTPKAISPDGDGYSDRAHVSYTLDEPATARLYVDGKLLVRGHFPRPTNKIDWDGRIDGRIVPGIHRLALAASDPAGNLGKPKAVGIVVVRFVKVGRLLIHVAPGGRITVTVSADHPRLTWRIGQRKGTFKGHVLHVQAPQASGRYRLRIGYDDHIVAVVVTVGAGA